MPHTSRRFPRMAYLRVLDRLSDAAAQAMPGGLSWEPLPGESQAAFRRRENRICDLEYIRKCAEQLQDAISTLR